MKRALEGRAAMHLLVLGTHNRKKGQELAQLLVPFGFELKTLADFHSPLVVEETGETFAENAALKAAQQACHLNAWVLGEDSGLSVDALDGRPGIFSARFAGPEATDATNNVRLLEELSSVPAHKRTAHYVCHVTLSDPLGEVRANWGIHVLRTDPAQPNRFWRIRIRPVV